MLSGRVPCGSPSAVRRKVPPGVLREDRDALLQPEVPRPLVLPPGRALRLAAVAIEHFPVSVFGLFWLFKSFFTVRGRLFVFGDRGYLADA